MENTAKWLSHNKEYRIVVANTHHVSLTQLKDFQGSDRSKRFLGEMMTASVLFSGINDFGQKTSVTFRLTKELSVYCALQDRRLRLEYAPSFEATGLDFDDPAAFRSTLSITTGDFSGLHTSTVLGQGADVSASLTFFNQQSEQLPTEFIVSRTNPALGLVVQPLPFAEAEGFKQIKATLAQRIERLGEANAESLAEHFADIGQLLWEREVQ